jgi:hypothetical protein
MYTYVFFTKLYTYVYKHYRSRESLAAAAAARGEMWRHAIVGCAMLAMGMLATTAAAAATGATPSPEPSAAAWAAAAWLNGSAGMLRREFTAGGPGLSSAHVYASTIGFHELRVNGAILGEQTDKVFEPGVAVYG